MTRIRIKKEVKDKITNSIKIFCCLLMVFSTVYYIKDNFQKRKNIEHTIESLFTCWNKKEMGKVYEIAKKNEEFHLTTGFEKNIEISQIIDEHIYGGVEYKLLGIKVSGLGQDNAKAQATISMKTYNNLEILNVIIEQLLKDDSEVTMDYNHEDFLNQNLENIKNAVKDVQKNSEVTVVIYLESQKSKWFIPYANNEDFYNSLAGNLITFNKEVEPEVEL